MKTLKGILAAFALLSIAATSPAQNQQATTNQSTNTQSAVPEAIKYQAVVRNSSGDVIANQNVSFRISILQGSAQGNAAYEETQQATTNQFGLANLAIGQGSVISGIFDSIKWGNDTYFVKVEFDPQGGSDFAVMGTSQLLSVPYSLYSAHAKVADNIPVFPIKAALQGTNLQVPFDEPETGMLVYNTDSAGSMPYSVVPGYYYNAGTIDAPNWVLLSAANSSNHKVTPDACTGLGTGNAFGACADANVFATGGYCTAYGFGAGENMGDGSYNTMYGYSSMGGFPIHTTTANTGVGSYSLYSINYCSSNTSVGSNCLYSNTADANTAIGDSALYSNTSGIGNNAVGYEAGSANTTGSYNIAVGYTALTGSTSTGSKNIAIGYNSMHANTSGGSNIAIGGSTLLTNTTGSENIVIGAGAGASNTTASDITGIGYQALDNNTTGLNNTATGANALALATTASSSTATGFDALYNNTGDANTAFGDSAGITNTSGKDNTYLGYKADNGQTGLTNTTCLGYNGGSYISTNNVSNAIQLGNSSITKIYAAVNTITVSDSRVKTSITENVPGLAFINLLRPVTYNYSLDQENELSGIKDATPEYEGKHDIENIRFSGFLAQEVETAAKKSGYDFSGVVPGKIYGLRYSEFVVPLVKAVQELNAKNEQLTMELDAIKQELAQIKASIK